MKRRIGHIVLPLLLVLGLAQPVLAAPTHQEPTTPTPATDTSGTVPDFGGFVNDISAGLEGFYQSAQVLMGFIAFFLVQALKWLLPKFHLGDTEIGSETIYGFVVGLFTIFYVIAQVMNYQAELGRAIDIGTLLANTMKAVLAMLAVPSASYAFFNWVGNPIGGGGQGDSAFSLVSPKRKRDQADASKVNFYGGDARLPRYDSPARG